MKFRSNSFLVAFGYVIAWSASFLSAQDTLQVGDKAPDFELVGLGDENVKLTDCLKKKPVVLVLSRASW